MAGLIDHTLLKPVATSEDIIKLCNEAKKFGFAAVCVNPFYVPLAKEQLSDSAVAVCAVVGFPLGAASIKSKAFEASNAVLSGASEIDMVINIGALKERLDDLVLADIAAVVEAVYANNHDGLVKVIIETCFLTEEEKIRACLLAEKGGARFVKTSTGFGTGGATVEDVSLMRKTVGKQVGVKASGGIKTLQQALAMIKAGANRIGASAGVDIIKEMIFM
ncbi:deoxyribose-phosphate aldolase [Desulfotruncus alcoholivorax]|uniref:deoxyribose-phosphate aldolase n=1 Tax=Desulfotruncus alcoholivorax TaxID=265477 RepID=UPI00055162E4|nr:deoxyribose-phosphate aldolase [Desulfotruncus alcoholivorax]